MPDSDQRFKDFAEASSDWFWEMDEDCRFTYFSDRFTEITGVPAADLLGKTREETGIPNVEAGEWQKHLSDLAAHRPFKNFRHPRTLADGRVVHLSINGKPIFDHEGRFRGYRGTGTDITEHVAAEQTTQVSEARFQGVFYQGSVGMAIITPAGHFLQVNEAYCSYLGYRPDELIGSHFNRVIHPDDLDGVATRAQRLLNGSTQGYQHERRYRHKQGHYVWGLAGLSLLRSPNGSALGIIVQVQDITQRKAAETALQAARDNLEQAVAMRTGELMREVAERKETEEALKAREAQIEHAQQMAKLGVFVWDNVIDKAIYYSGGLTALLGMSDEQMRKWGDSHASTLEQVEPEDRAHYHQMVRDAEKAVIALDVEYRIRDAAGDLRHWREMGEPITDDQGRLIRTIGTIQDITEVKAAEERLRQAQKMEAVGQLTGGVAHDFNNLLAVIMGNVELLKDAPGQEVETLDPILRAAERGAELTQRLLAFSRQQSLRPQVIDLDALVTGMSELLSRTLGETIEIKIGRALDLWAASADPGQVENALLNLTLNARDAMPGGGKLTIECANAQLDAAYLADNPEARAGDYVVLAVTDQGSGMTAEVQAHAFEPFFTTKEVGQGSGLGLSMIYGFAKQSDGHVSLYSEEGRGTTVKLYLPRAEEAVRQADTKDVTEVPCGQGELILVIEDDPDVRALAVALLEHLGYRAIDVAEAVTAHEVLAEEKSVDLVLSDVVLPGGTSGPAFAEQARRVYPDLKIIFMSGYPAEAAKRNGFLGSNSVLLNKPFQRQQLAKALRDALA